MRLDTLPDRVKSVNALDESLDSRDSAAHGACPLPGVRDVEQALRA